VNHELDEALVRDFPMLYAQRHRPMNETCMCWGFGCGDGWEPLIRELSEQLEWLNRTDAVLIEAVQVKEKFGTLRFYTAIRDCDSDFPWRMVDALVDSATHRSGVTCEECGRLGERRDGGWIRTLCDECEAARRGMRRKG
jgi:hypothetical protein